MPHQGKASYQSIRDEVLRRIHNGTWPQGSLLPPEVELAAEFSCARATVNRALSELAERGIVERKRKSGTRIVTAPIKNARIEIAVVRHMVEAQNAAYRYALVKSEVSEIPAWLAAQLDLARSCRVRHLKCMHYADNQPYQFEERWINTEAVPAVLQADFSKTGPNEWLLRKVPLTDAEISFSAVAADAVLAEFLATRPGAALFQLERTTWLRHTPVTFVRMTFHPGYRMHTRY